MTADGAGAAQLGEGEGAEERAVAGEEAVAVIGIGGRFPGAGGVEEFWRLLRDGGEGITRYSAEELTGAGWPRTSIEDPSFVPAAGALEGPGLFDAGFFGFTGPEAELTDPQQRLFLECSWHAIEHAGYAPDELPGHVGVFVSGATSAYRFERVARSPRAAGAHPMEIAVGNDLDMLALRLSYKLDLKGPSVTVQSACSSSLVSVHLACQSLLNRESDLAVAGGVAVRTLEPEGYHYTEGDISSADGHCRPFDASATGTVSGDGVGVLVLKRLDEAVADRDHIQAVILGSAVNNDGASKAGFTAPSPDGQAAVISEALAVAGAAPESIGYIEAHGTATQMGDPIEVQALTEVFGRRTAQAEGADAQPAPTVLGSAKSNIGHADAAAGVIGLIKTALSLERGVIPPTRNFERPNPEMGLEDSPFTVSSSALPWPERKNPPRAGVSSFGIGGTNAHVVLEAAPAVPPSPPPQREWHLLPLSARTPEALEATAARLAERLRMYGEQETQARTGKSGPGTAPTAPRLADVAYTLQTGRSAFPFRRTLVCRDRSDALEALEAEGSAGAGAAGGQEAPGSASVALLLPGQASQYPGMGAQLYRTEPEFARALDECAELLTPNLGWDVRQVAFATGTHGEAEGRELLRQTSRTQPAVFALDYAMARQLTAWGVRPDALVGHSVGELVAATLAGVFTLEDGLRVVAERARLMQEMPPGRMLAVALSEKELLQLLGEQAQSGPDEGEFWSGAARPEIAAVNGPESCVAAGSTDGIAALGRLLHERGVACRELETSHAFHTASMDAALPGIAEVVRTARLRSPQLPFTSNVTGTWITDEQAKDPDYWAEQARGTVRFADGVTAALERGATVLLETGPGAGLSGQVRGCRRPDGSRPAVLTTMGRRREPAPDECRSLYEGLGGLWRHGVPVDWEALHTGEDRRRVPLPGYPFERRDYLLPRTGATGPAGAVATGAADGEAREALPAGEPGGGEQTPAASPESTGAGLAAAETGGWDPAEVWPDDEVARSVAEIWQEVLGADRFGPDSDFFELGGNSLIAIQIVSRLRQRHGELPMSAIFEAPTVTGVAAVIREQQARRVPLDEFEALLREVEGLSPEEAQAEMRGKRD